MKEIAQPIHVPVPSATLVNLFSIETVSVTGLCCTTIPSFDVTETRATRLCPKEVCGLMQERNVRRQMFTTLIFCYEMQCH